jgi:hypothetical protein
VTRFSDPRIAGHVPMKWNLTGGDDPCDDWPVFLHFGSAYRTVYDYNVKPGGVVHCYFGKVKFP